MGALEGKAQEMTQRAETLEGGALRLPLWEAVLRSASDRSGCWWRLY